MTGTGSTAWRKLAWRTAAGFGIGLLAGRATDRWHRDPTPPPPPAARPVEAAEPNVPRAGLTGRPGELLEWERLLAEAGPETLAAAFRAERMRAPVTGDAGWFEELGRAWAARDPDGFAAELAGEGSTIIALAGLPAPVDFARPLFVERAASDPEAAFAAAGRFGSRAVRDRLRWAVVTGLFDIDPALALRFVASQAAALAPPGVDQVPDVCHHAAAAGRVAALADAAAGLPPVAARARLLSATLGVWSRSEPEATQRWWESLDPELQAEALAGLPGPHPNTSTWTVPRWQALATALAARPDPGRHDAFFRACFAAWARVDLPAALAWADAAAECRARLPAIRDAVAAAARDDTGRALAGSDALTTLAGRAAAARPLAEALAAQSPDAARDWVRAMPVGYVRDEAGEALDAL